MNIIFYNKFVYYCSNKVCVELKVRLYHFVMKILNGYNFLVVDPIVLI